MKKIVAVFLCLFSFHVFAETSESRAELMIFGTFHFHNPGLDQVKNKQTDVGTLENQQYLKEFSERVAVDFKPSHVLLECARDQQNEISSNFKRYIAGDYELKVNENDQLGYRIAKLAGIDAPTCYDEREIGWQPERLMEELPTKEPRLKREFDAAIDKVTKEGNQMYAELSLKQVFNKLNSLDSEQDNQYLYILTNEVGADGGGFSGADASASWWHRNFRMYANIQKVAQNGTRVFVIGGQGHTAILKNFLSLDKKRVAHSVDPYL